MVRRLSGDAGMRALSGKDGREKVLCECDLNDNIRLAIDTLEGAPVSTMAVFGGKTQWLARDSMSMRARVARIVQMNPAASNDDREEYRVVRATQGHAAGMARCHICCFPDQFTSEMGLRFARGFYRQYIADTEGIALVALHPRTGAVVGIVVGGRPDIRREYIVNAVRQWPGTLVWRGIVNNVVRRALFKEFTRRVSSGRGVHGPVEVELDSEHWQPGERWALMQVICALPDARGTGAAGELIRGFEAACHQSGYEAMYLSVDSNNDRAVAFYEKHGWKRQLREGHTLVMRKGLVS